MKKQFTNLLIITSTLLFTACGGGSDSANTTSSSSSLTSTSTTNTLVSSVIQSGSLVVVDAGVVVGLSAKCSSINVPTVSDGSFRCSTTPIAIYLGDFKLGEVDTIPSDNSLFIQDLVGVSRAATSHPDVTKLSMILQSLDDDAQPLNGITLAQDTLSLLSSNLSSHGTLNTLTFEEVEQIINDVISTRLAQDEDSKLVAVDKITAHSNLTITTAGIPSPTYIQRAPGRSL